MRSFLLTMFLTLSILTPSLAGDLTFTKDGRTTTLKVDEDAVTYSGGVLRYPVTSLAEVMQPESFSLTREDGTPVPLPDPTPDPTPTVTECTTGAECVGPGKKTLAEAIAAVAPGGIIEFLPGSHQLSESEGAVTKADVTVRAVPGQRAAVSCAGVRPAWSKACLLGAANGLTVVDLDVSGAAISNAMGGNAACFRTEPGLDMTLEGVTCTGSQNGVLGDTRNLVIRDSKFFGNGNTGASARTHELYLNAACESLTIENSIIGPSKDAHAVKSRCKVTTIVGSDLRANNIGAAVDASNGGTVSVATSKISKPSGANNGNLVAYAFENCLAGPGGLTLDSVTFSSLRAGVNWIANGPDGNSAHCKGVPLMLANTVIPAPINVGGFTTP